MTNDRYWNSELQRWVYPDDNVDGAPFWERKYLEKAIELDALRMAVEDLSDWYLQKDACDPGNATGSLGVANDLQSLLYDFSDCPQPRPSGHIFCDGCHVEP